MTGGGSPTKNHNKHWGEIQEIKQDCNLGGGGKNMEFFRTGENGDINSGASKRLTKKAGNRDGDEWQHHGRLRSVL